MPNEVDIDRLAAKNVDLKVVSLARYKADAANRADAPAASGYQTPFAMNALAVVLAIFGLLLLLRAVR